MYSNKSNYDYGQQRRPHSGRGSKPWGEDDKREEWKEPPRNPIRDSYDKYAGDGHNWSEKVSSSEYSEAYTREYNSDTDWRKKHASSHERSASEKRRRTLEDDDEYRYQHQPEDSYRQSPEKYSQRNKEFKHTVSVEEGYSRRKTPEDSRYRQHQDEFHYSQYKSDTHYRPVTEYYKDRDSRERSRSPERRRSPVCSKSYSPPRQRSDGFSRDHEDHNLNRTRFPLNGSSRLPEPSHRRLSPPPLPPPPLPAATAAAAAGEKKMTKGFQRFLDVLNMGVNMDTLTQIVSQGSPEVKACQPSSPPQVERPWTAEPSQRQNQQYRPQSERSPQRPTSQLSRSYSSNGKTMSEKPSMESRHLEEECSSPTINTPNFDEHKRKQMHDVLQAIGIKLEFEELGQMSSRIQERLYGKKQSDNAPPNREEEREKKRQAYVPKRRSPSSSGSSSSSSSQDFKRSHSYSAQWEDMDNKFPYQTDSHGAQQRPSKYPTQVISPTTHRTPNHEAAPMPSHAIPPPGPINFPPPPFPNLPPTFPPVMPNMFMPQQPPPFLPPYPQTPPIQSPNIFPPAGAPFSQTRRHPYLNLIMIPPAEYSNFENVQKSKNDHLKRHRYLQQVPTKK